MFNKNNIQYSIALLFSSSCLWSGNAPTTTCNQLALVNNGATVPLGATAINSNCQAVAVWAETTDPIPEGGRPVVGAIFKNNAWEASTLLSNGSGLDQIIVQATNNAFYQGQLAADINSDGKAFVVWINADDNKLYGSRYVPNVQSWLAPVAIPTNTVAGVGVSYPSLTWVTIDDDGKTTHVIRSSEDVNNSNSVTYFGSNDCGDTWPDSLIRELSPQGIPIDVSFTYFARSDDKKNMIVVWATREGSITKNLQAAVYSNGSWNIPAADQFIDSAQPGQDFAIEPLGVSINNSGHAILLYKNGNLSSQSMDGAVKGACYNGQVWSLTTLKENITILGIIGAISLSNNDRGLSAIKQSINTQAVSSWDTFNQVWNPVDTSSIVTSNLVNAVALGNNDNGNGVFVTLNSVSRAHFDFESKSWSSALPINCFSGNDALAQGYERSASNGILMDNNLNVLTYCNTAVPFSINQPTNLVGTCATNRFASQSERFAMIKWGASITNNEVQYAIFRDNVLLGVVPVTQKTFTEHNLTPGNKTYGVRAISATGDISTETTVPLACP